VDGDEWLHVGTLHRTGHGVDLRRQHPGGEQQAVRDLLAAAGHGAVRDEDVRVDLVCVRNDQLDSWLAVHVRRTPSPVRQKRKPRQPDGAQHGGQAILTGPAPAADKRRRRPSRRARAERWLGRPASRSCGTRRAASRAA
jgi:hypothetical protein